MTDSASAPGADLTARVRAVDGVTDVYSPRSAVVRLTGVIAAVGRSDHREAEIAVSVRDGVPVVAARIATAASDDTPQAARRAADVLLEHSPPDATVTIQIARIH